MAKIIGIDLGTTYSAVSVWDDKKKEAVILENLRGNRTTPSVQRLGAGLPAWAAAWVRCATCCVLDSSGLKGWRRDRCVYFLLS